MSKRAKQRIAVVSGGFSHEANFSSAPWLVSALSALGHDVVALEYSDPAFLSTLHEEHIDLVFPQTLGAYGEDGVFQGLLEFLDLPYVGSGVTASALCANKWVCSKYLKSVAFDAQTRPWGSPRSHLISRTECCEFTFLADEIGLPFIIKPALGGASFGVELIRTKAEYDAALNKNIDEFEWLIAEQFIKGIEFCWGFIEGEHDRIFLPIERIRENYGHSIHSQSDKMIHKSMLECSVPLDIRSMLEPIGRSISAAIGIRGFASIDIIIDKHEQPFVIDINTLPGLIPNISKLPLMCKKAGIGYLEMVDLLISSARTAQPMHIRKLAHPPPAPMELRTHPIGV